MTTDNTYNGWTNYATWVANLWLDNDQGSQEMVIEEARECLQRAIDRDDDKDDAISSLATWLEEMHDENAPKAEGVYADLLAHALAAVEWREIARHHIEEIDCFSAGFNVPGFLPDSAPSLFLDADDAREHIATEMERFADDMDEASEAEAATLTAAAEACRAGSGEFGETVAGLHYFVSKA